MLGYIAISARILMLGSERIFLKKLEKFNSVAITSLFSLLAVLFLTPVLLFLEVSDFYIPQSLVFIAFIGALFYSIGFYSYVYAISIGDAALVAPLYNSSLLWLLFIGFFWLQEDVSWLRGLGAILMFIGVFFLYRGNIAEKINAIKTSKASIVMIIGSIFMAFGRSIDAFVIREVNEVFYALFTNFFVGLFLLILLVLQNQVSSLTEIINEKPKSLLAAGFTNGWAYLFLLIAIPILEVTVAEPLGLLSTFITAILARYFLNEKVIERLPGMMLMVSGAVFLIIF